MTTKRCGQIWDIFWRESRQNSLYLLKIFVSWGIYHVAFSNKKDKAEKALDLRIKGQRVKFSYMSYQRGNLRIPLKFSGLKCLISKIKILTLFLTSLQDCNKHQWDIFQMMCCNFNLTNLLDYQKFSIFFVKHRLMLMVNRILETSKLSSYNIHTLPLPA